MKTNPYTFLSYSPQFSLICQIFCEKIYGVIKITYDLNIKINFFSPTNNIIIFLKM